MDNTKTKKILGKTYNFSSEEKEVIERHLAIINIQQGIVHALQNEVERVKMIAKDRVKVDPYTHTQVDYKNWTFFVPDIKPDPKVEIGKEVKNPNK